MELVRKCVAENRKEVPSLLILGEPSPSIAWTPTAEGSKYFYASLKPS